MAALRHPGLPEVFDSGTADGPADTAVCSAAARALRRARLRLQPVSNFALVPEGKVGNYERRRLADAGIELLAYPNPDGSHAELLRMLHDLAAS